MNKQLGIYERGVPLSPKRHKDMSVDVGKSFKFASEVPAIPIVASEFPRITREFPIAFTQAGDHVQTLAIVGLREGQNLFVAGDERWLGSYVPAFLRRYPFILQHRGETDEYVLCIDEAFKGLNTKGRGEALFEKDGSASGFLDSVLAFNKSYQKEAMLTQAFGDRLKEAGLLVPIEATFGAPSEGQQTKARGLLAVDRKRLHALDKDAVEKLFRSGDLERIHLHLQSLANFETLAAKLSKRAGARKKTA